VDLREIKALAERIERIPFSEIDRRIPRLSKLLAVVKLNEEERALVVKALLYFSGDNLEGNPGATGSGSV